MNKVVLIGRLTRDPEIRANNDKIVAKYTLAVDRYGKDRGADFISCTAFGKSAEFADKYLKQGTKIVVLGRIETGSYTNRDGQKIYTTDVIVEEHEFAESRQNAPESRRSAPGNSNEEVSAEKSKTRQEGFYDVAEEGLPWE